MKNRADQAVAAVSVIITAARPVAIVIKILEHQVEQLHRLGDVGFRHWLSAPDPGNELTVSRQMNRFDQIWIVILHVADARAERPAHHAIGR